MSVPPPCPGRVAIVGAGPGDPDLLTVKALRLLQRADVVLHDRLVSSDILALCRDDARMIHVGKTPHGRSTAQEVIQALLVKEARGGHFVVRLKGGDPFVFGRGGEEAIHLREAGVPCEIVPGISSCIAVPERVGIPVTHRGISTSFSVVTGYGAANGVELEQQWYDLARAGGTVVVLMGLSRLPRIVRAFLDAGREPSTPAAVIHRGTTEDEAVLVSTLGAIADDVAASGIRNPATIVVGDVVALRERIAAVLPIEVPVRAELAV